MSKVTARDLARKTGVSVGTVSRIINNLPGHAPETVARVRAAMYELGFLMPLSKVKAGKKQLRQVCLLFPDYDDYPRGMITPLGVDLARGADEVLAGQRQQLLVTQMRGINELPYCITRQQVDGVLIRNAAAANPVLEKMITLPSVWIYGVGRLLPGRDAVTTDNFQIGQLAAELLLATEKKKFLLITHQDRFFEEFQLRHFSCRMALEKAGKTVESVSLQELPGKIRYNSGEGYGVFIPGHDMQVTEASNILQDSKSGRAGKLPMVGMITEVDLFQREYPWIQGITVSHREIGRIAAQQLLWRIQNPHESSRTLLVPPRAVKNSKS